MPLDTGSTSVSVMAVARIASTALPPAASICKPAWAASGCEVDTTLEASSGLRGHAYGLFQENGVMCACILRLASYGFEVEHHASDHFAGLEILERRVGLIGRTRFDGGRADLALLGERDHFLQLLQAADVGADDADRTLSDWRQRVHELAAVEAADDVAAAFSQGSDAERRGRRAADEIDRPGKPLQLLQRVRRPRVQRAFRAELPGGGKLRVIDIARDDVLHAFGSQH